MHMLHVFGALLWSAVGGVDTEQKGTCSKYLLISPERMHMVHLQHEPAKKELEIQAVACPICYAHA